MNADTYKILAVDDNPINIKLLERALKNNHFRVVTATSGEEAIKLSVSEKPDLILLDVLMPGMDGYDTCQELSSMDATSHIPIIFLSAKNETVDKARGLALGAVDYLTKPFNPVEINARIRSHLKVREEAISLRHQNDALQQQLAEFKKKQSQNSDNPAGMIYIEQIIPASVEKQNKYFEIVSGTKSGKPPATTLFLPVYLNMFNLIYITVGGFKKDYQTAVVQLMLEKFVRGYIQGDAIKNFSDKFLARLLEQVLDTFSPDIYDSPFTISLCYINAVKYELTLFSIHQDTPLIFDAERNVMEAEALPVFFESKYSSIIRARHIHLAENSLMVNYIKGREQIGDTELNKRIVPAVNKKSTDNLLKFNNELINALPKNEQDQLIFSIRLL